MVALFFGEHMDKIKEGALLILKQALYGKGPNGIPIVILDSDSVVQENRPGNVLLCIGCPVQYEHARNMKVAKRGECIQKTEALHSEWQFAGGVKEKDYSDWCKQDIKIFKVWAAKKTSSYGQQTIMKDVILNENISAQFLIKAIVNAAQRAVKNESFQLTLYYTGHSCKDTGNWNTFGDESISLK